jgi:ATP-dependent DNA helicase 2 subunit 1
LNVEIELFPIEVDKKFQIEHFYVDIITYDPDDLTKDVICPTTRLSELALRLRRKEFKKRMLGRTCLQLGGDFQVGTKFFCTVGQARRPGAVHLDGTENFKQLRNLTKFSCEETGAELYPNQIGTYMPFGGEKIVLSKDEVSDIKKFDDPSLVLMGFKPYSRLKEYHNYRTSYFLYPDDEKIEGSSQVFHSLIETLLAKDKIAIVRFIPKKASEVSFAALLPQREEYDEDANQRPPGFNLIF